MSIPIIISVVALSGVSIYFIGTGLLHSVLKLVLGLAGAAASTIAIYSYNYSNLRLIIHVVSMVILSLLVAYALRESLTNRQ